MSKLVLQLLLVFEFSKYCIDITELCNAELVYTFQCCYWSKEYGTVVDIITVCCPWPLEPDFAIARVLMKELHVPESTTNVEPANVIDRKILPCFNIDGANITGTWNYAACACFRVKNLHRSQWNNGIRIG